MSRSRSGISPVVATVILVAIAIVIAIAVAFWATGLVGIFTRFEKVEIRTAYATVQNDQYIIHLSIANTGSADVTIDDIYINGRPSTTYNGINFGDGCGDLTSGKPVPLRVGERLDCTIGVDVGAPFTPGTTIEVAVHTGTGKLYPAAVLLP
jgi:flagellin-like protein